MADSARRNSRDENGDGGSPLSDSYVREVLVRLEKKLDNDEEFRRDVRDGLSDCQTRLTRIESEIAGSGGIVGRAVCREREKAVTDRIDALDKKHDGLLTWIRLITVAVIGSALTALWAVIRGK
jgi:hypothetical protein